VCPITAAGIIVTTKDRQDAGWSFDNSFMQLPEAFFSRTNPEPVKHAVKVLFNEDLANDLGLDVDVLRSSGAQVFAGNEIPPGAAPLAQAYAGHQFGHFTNLGDGRAVLLGEHVTPKKHRVDVQLKGSGRTCYSRSGDGRAVLGPMLREYIISEGMYSLGVPSTRSLAVTATGENVLRNLPLPGAILTRVAESHIRIGTFQYAAALGDKNNLSQLLKYTVARHYPELPNAPDLPFTFFRAVLDKQASLVARWMFVGFVHGVLNTDNVSIAGETIDYGPCAFTQWNLARLAESLLLVCPGEQDKSVEKFVSILETFSESYETYYQHGTNAKLGLRNPEKEDAVLYRDLLDIMKFSQADFSSTFVALSHALENEHADPVLMKMSGFDNWVQRWRERLSHESSSLPEIAKRMRSVNPVIVPRNLQVEEALAEAESGNIEPAQRLLGVLQAPFSETLENELYRKGAPPGSASYCTFCGT
jgi:uncharacterized protein YdiU (UPF0061 family)